MASRRTLLGMASMPIWATVGLGLAAAMPAESNEGNLVGTYQVIVCRGPCSFASAENAVVEGTFVLLADEIQAMEASKLDAGFQPVLSRGNANGCYVLRRVSNRVYEGYANTRGPALTVWSQTHGELHLSLFRSPDAGYEVVLRGDAQVLAGGAIVGSWRGCAQGQNDGSRDRTPNRCRRHSQVRLRREAISSS